jgi:two-component system KDP operon response regulator KdpE
MRARLLLQGPTTPRRPPHALPLYDDGRLCLDLDARRVSVSERPVRLTPREFEILAYLYRNAGHVLTICQILEDIWGWECRDNPEYVHAYISRLRRKLEPDPTHPIYLISEFGIGYRFERQPAAGA